MSRRFVPSGVPIFINPAVTANYGNDHPYAKIRIFRRLCLVFQKYSLTLRCRPLARTIFWKNKKRYAYNIMFDYENDNVVYAVGCCSENECIYIFKSGINTVNIDHSQNDLDMFDLSGRKVNVPKPGAIYIQSGKKIIK